MDFAFLLCCLLLTLQLQQGLTSGHDLIITGDEQTKENDLIVKKTNENLTLSCSLAGSPSSEDVQWFWILPFQSDIRPHTVQKDGGILKLFVDLLQPSDAGKYTCESNVRGLSVDTYVAVRPHNPVGMPYCSPSMFFCGDNTSQKINHRCIPSRYLCDGVFDCPWPSMDEAFEVCGTSDPCADKLRCRDGRCIPKSWCCIGYGGCMPHSCCAEHAQDDFPPERTGGGLKKYPEPYLLQATLFKVCACFIVVITTATILISAVCRARLKRTNRRLDATSPDQLDVVTHDCVRPSPYMQDCPYVLVCDDDNDSFEVMNHYPPSYSEVTSANALNPAQTSPSSELVPTPPAETSFPAGGPETGETVSVPPAEGGSPARRPNDFGMGFIANAIFNSRYRPVPQQNLEISSIDYATDSDSSCRSPTVRPGNPMNLRTLEFNSHFYGERIGETPDVTFLRGFSDGRRTRHSNALDRILDRFGLNAPYNVDVDRDADRTAWECQSFFSPPDYTDSGSPRNGSGPLSNFWTRLKNRFGRSSHEQRSGRRTSTQNNQTDERVVNNRRRRRPDTPDVPERTFSEGGNATRGLSSFLHDDRQYEVYGSGSAAQMRYFQQRGCLIARDLQLVPSHNFPPPYSQVAPDPPPPYVSRENLLRSSENDQVAVVVFDDGPSDQNGNVFLENLPDATNSLVVSCNDNDAAVAPETVDHTAALNHCDDNGNVECSSDTAESDNAVSASNVPVVACEVGTDCDECTVERKCSRHDNRISPANCEESSDRDLSDGNGNALSETVVLDKLDENLRNRVSADSNNSDKETTAPDQNRRTSVPDLTKTTEERCLAFPPQNLEFIDSDANVDYL